MPLLSCSNTFALHTDLLDICCSQPAKYFVYSTRCNVVLLLLTAISFGGVARAQAKGKGKQELFLFHLMLSINDGVCGRSWDHCTGTCVLQGSAPKSIGSPVGLFCCCAAQVLRTWFSFAWNVAVCHALCCCSQCHGSIHVADCHSIMAHFSVSCPWGAKEETDTVQAQASVGCSARENYWQMGRVVRLQVVPEAKNQR